MHEQARRWVETGHRVTLFTARPRGQRFKDSIDGVEVFRAGGRYSVYLIAPIAYLLVLRGRADVVLDIENGIPFFTPFFSSKPKVLVMHHVHQDQFLVELGRIIGRFGRLAERYVLPFAYRRSLVIADSGSTSRRMRELLPRADSLRIEVVQPGLDQGYFVHGVEKYDEPTIVYLGRIKTYKRLPLLIDIFASVRERVPGARLLVAGDGDALPELRSAIERHGLEDLVSVLGRVSDEEKVALLQRAWVAVSTSMNEGWGLTVVEANACGTPAVAFRVPGLDEAISDGQAGLLADSNEDFVRHLVKILTEPVFREELSRGAVDWAAGFSWDETAARSLRLLEEVASFANASGPGIGRRADPVPVCPRCLIGDGIRGGATVESRLESMEQDLRCPACGTEYPVLDGIPVLVSPSHRLEINFPDPAVSREHEQFETNATKRVASLVGRHSAGLSLDVGCGKGPYLDRFGGDLVVVDVNHFFVSEALKRYRGSHRVTGVVADIRALPFAERTFDFTLSSEVLEHLEGEDLRLAIASLKRTSAGLVLVDVPNESPFFHALRKFTSLVGLYREKQREDAALEHHNLVTAPKLRAEGFEVRGCINAVSRKRIRLGPAWDLYDFLVWRAPSLAGTLIGMYKKD